MRCESGLLLCGPSDHARRGRIHAIEQTRVGEGGTEVTLEQRGLGHHPQGGGGQRESDSVLRGEETPGSTAGFPKSMQPAACIARRRKGCCARKQGGPSSCRTSVPLCIQPAKAHLCGPLSIIGVKSQNSGRREVRHPSYSANMESRRYRINMNPAGGTKKKGPEKKFKLLTKINTRDAT